MSGERGRSLRWFESRKPNKQTATTPTHARSKRELSDPHPLQTSTNAPYKLPNPTPTRSRSRRALYILMHVPVSTSMYPVSDSQGQQERVGVISQREHRPLHCTAIIAPQLFFSPPLLVFRHSQHWIGAASN